MVGHDGRRIAEGALRLYRATAMVCTARIVGLLLVVLAISAGAATLREVSEFGSNPGNLRMFEYVPDNVPASPALVVALHGCTQSAADYADGPAYNKLRLAANASST